MININNPFLKSLLTRVLPKEIQLLVVLLIFQSASRRFSQPTVPDTFDSDIHYSKSDVISATDCYSCILTDRH